MCLHAIASGGGPLVPCICVRTHQIYSSGSNGMSTTGVSSPAVTDVELGMSPADRKRLRKIARVAIVHVTDSPETSNGCKVYRMHTYLVIKYSMRSFLRILSGVSYSCTRSLVEKLQNPDTTNSDADSAS